MYRTLSVWCGGLFFERPLSIVTILYLGQDSTFPFVVKYFINGAEHRKTYLLLFIHSCEKLKNHFFEVSFQNERKGCFDAIALVAASRLYLMIPSFFFLIFLIVFWGWLPDKWQNSKVERKNGKISISAKRCSGQPRNSCQWCIFWLYHLDICSNWPSPMKTTHFMHP